MKDRIRKNNSRGEDFSEKNSTNKFKIKERNYSINQKDDILSNNNIYNDDNKYFLNSFLTFNQESEENFKDFYNNLYINNFSYILVSIYYLRFLYKKITNFKELFHLKYIIIIHLISYFVTLYYIYNYKKKNNIDKYNFFIKSLFDFNHSIHFYRLCKHSYNNMNLLSEILFNNSFILIINLPFYYIVISDAIIFMIFLSISLNKFSYNIFREFFVSFSFNFFIFYNIKKSIKENWVLFDSFKNSYIIIDNLFLKSNPNPIIIMNKNNNIFYTNKPAKNLIANLVINNSPSNNDKNSDNNLKKKPAEKSSQNFENLLHPKLKNYFFKELRDIIENKYIESFYFPFFHVKENDINMFNISNINEELFDFDYQDCIWYNVIVKECIWKNQECYFLNLISCNEYYTNNLFNKILKQIIEYYDKYINNIDNICDIILKNEKNFNFYYDNVCLNNTNHINSNTSANTNQNRNSSSNIYHVENGNYVNIKNINNTPKLKNKNLFLFKRINKSDSIKNFVSPRNSMSNLNNLINGNIILNNNNNNYFSNNINFNYFPDFDFTILFFFKNQAEKLYDLALTKEIYFSLLFQRLYSDNNNNTNVNNFFLDKEEEDERFLKKSIVNIPNICDYFYHYFSELLIEKNFTLKFLIKDNIEDIYIEESFLRTFIFNTILFIISNSNDNTSEKNIIVNIKKIKNEKKSDEEIEDTNEIISDNNDNLYFEFNVNEKKSLNNNVENNLFSDINTLLKKHFKKYFSIKNELEKEKYLNISILNVYYLVSSYYYKDFNIISKKKGYQINFELTYNNINNKERPSSNELNNFKYCINEHYFKKVMKDIFKIEKLEKKENIVLSQNKNIFKLNRHQSFYENKNKNLYDDDEQKNNISDNESKKHNKSLFFQKSLDDKDIDFSRIKSRKSLFNYENKHKIFNDNEKKKINKNFSKLKSDSFHFNFNNNYLFYNEKENEEKLLFYNMKVQIKTFYNNKEIDVIEEDKIYNPFLYFAKKNEDDSFDNNKEKNKVFFYKNILEEFKPKKRINIIEDDMQLLKELKRNIFYFNKDILIEIYNNINLAYKNIKNKHKKGELYSLIFISTNNMTLKNGKNIFKLIKDLEKDQENKSKLVCLVKNESNEIKNIKNMFDLMLKIPYNRNELGNILSQLNK